VNFRPGTYLTSLAKKQQQHRLGLRGREHDILQMTDRLSVIGTSPQRHVIHDINIVFFFFLSVFHL
jgi:hypothetical protein